MASVVHRHRLFDGTFKKLVAVASYPDGHSQLPSLLPTEQRLSTIEIEKNKHMY